MSKLQYLILLCLFPLMIFGQNNQVIYDFDEIPQTLLLNPGSKYSHDIFVGVPLLSGISIDPGVTGITAYDIFSDNGVNINEKIRDVIYDLKDDDALVLNEKLEVFTAGIRLKNNSFLSFGMYEEFDMVLYFPVDVIQLFYEGTSNLDKRYQLNGINFKADFLGVLHAGLTRKVNDKLTIGGRVKLYSSVFNAQTKNNKGEFYTTLGNDNIYRHTLLNVEGTVQTTGVIYDNYADFEPNDFARKLYTFENPGFGFDLGFTHEFNDQLLITGSVLDIGFVRNSKDVFSYDAKGDYDFEGIELVFDPDSPQDYWGELKMNFEENVQIDTIYSKYNSYRPVKINASTKYSFGKPHYEDCYLSNADDPYRNAVGIQFFGVKRPLKPLFAATLFYERRFGKFLRTKVTYTIDHYSSNNIGFGISSKIGPVNLYMAMDNLLYLQNLAKANSSSFHLGVNVIFDKKNP